MNFQNMALAIAERLSLLGSAAIITLLVYLLSTLLYWLIAGKNRWRRIQGNIVRSWVTGSFAAGSVAATLLPVCSPGTIGVLGGMGLVVGLVAGHVHGAVRADLATYATEVVDDDDLRRPENELPLNQNNDNPYVPPSQL